MKKQFFVLLTLALFFFSLSSIKAFNDYNNLMRSETKDEIIFIKDNEKGGFEYSWSFDKKDYKKNEFDFDLGISFDSPKKNIINGITGNIKKQFISFNHHGMLPSKAIIKVPVFNNFKEGDVVKLYYYDENSNIIKLMDSNVKIINGYVSFEISHCSDYFLTLSVIKNTEGSNNNGIIIILMLVVIVGLIGYTLFNNKK